MDISKVQYSRVISARIVAVMAEKEQKKAQQPLGETVGPTSDHLGEVPKEKELPMDK